MTVRRVLANVALVVAACLLPLLVLEVVLRVRGAVPASMFETDPVYLYKTVPGGHKFFTHRPANGGNTVRIAMNADGFRGPPLRAQGGVPRVIVYGDSFIEGEFAEDSLTFVRMLERALSKKQPTEVLNAGVVSWGPDQEFLRMQHDMPIYKPKLVVLSIFADNDMGDLIRDKLVRLTPDSALEWRRPIVHPELDDMIREQAHPTGWRRLHLVRWVERKLRAPSGALLPSIRKQDGPVSLATYGDWAMANAARQFAEFQASPDTVVELLGDSYDVDISATPGAESARYKVALMDRLLGQIQQYLASQNIPLVLVDIPSPIDICESYDAKIDSAKFPQYERRRISRIVDSLAAKHGIKHVDLWPVFEANDPCSLYYRQGDLHWKENGQMLAVGMLVDSLATWRLTP